jgi:hypothetical protein
LISINAISGSRGYGDGWTRLQTVGVFRWMQ